MSSEIIFHNKGSAGEPPAARLLGHVTSRMGMPRLAEQLAVGPGLALIGLCAAYLLHVGPSVEAGKAFTSSPEL